MSHVNLANAAHEGGELAAAREHYETALRFEPDHAEAHQGLANVLAELGDAAARARHRQMGFEQPPVSRCPIAATAAGVAAAAVASAGGNIPTRHFLDDRVFQTIVVVAGVLRSATAAAAASAGLQCHRRRRSGRPRAGRGPVVCWPDAAPVINAPAAVLATGRSDNARASRIARSGHAAHRHAAARILLAAGRRSHAGPPRLRIPAADPHSRLSHRPSLSAGRSRATALPAALAELPGDELTVLQYLDARGADGKVRKYRVMMIDGGLYPLHVAISSHWKIHYFTADMADRPEHRAEDAEFLENMPAVLGPRAMAALARIQITCSGSTMRASTSA